MNSRMTELATQTLHTVAREIGVALSDGRAALEAHVEQPGNMELLERCRARAAPGAGRAAAAGDLRRGAAGRGDGAGRALPDQPRLRAQEPGRGARRADARDGAAAGLPGAGAGRWPRSGAGAVAAVERPAGGARQRAAVGRHAAAAEPQVRSPGTAGGTGTGRAAAVGRAVGAAPAGALPDRPDRLDSRRTHRAEPGDHGRGRDPPGTGRGDAAGVPAVVGGRGFDRVTARERSWTAASR